MYVVMLEMDARGSELIWQFDYHKHKRRRQISGFGDLCAVLLICLAVIKTRNR
jgi:hypothetical protein